MRDVHTDRIRGKSSDTGADFILLLKAVLRSVSKKAGGEVIRDVLKFYQVPPERIVDLIFILEGYEGVAVPRTLDGKLGIIELLVAPDFEDLLEQALDIIREEFPVNEIDRPPHVKSISDD